MNNRNIDFISIIVQDGYTTIMQRKNGETMKYVSENFGDHGENWICILDNEGNETRRINTKVVADIIWLPEPNLPDLEDHKDRIGGPGS